MTIFKELFKLVHEKKINRIAISHSHKFMYISKKIIKRKRFVHQKKNSYNYYLFANIDRKKKRNQIFLCQ